MSLAKSYLSHREKHQQIRKREGKKREKRRKRATHPYNIEVEDTIIDGA